MISAYLFGAGFAATAEDAPAHYMAGAMMVEEPWTRATPKGADTAVGYLTLTNTGEKADRLMGGSSAAARKLELHEMSTADGVMTMRSLESLAINPGQSLTFKPGGLHIMLTGLAAPVKEGDKIKATLMFETAGAVDIEFTAAGIGATAPAGGHDHAH